MADAIGRLYDAVIEARDNPSPASRTSRLIAGGRSKIAKKIGEEATEVAIDAAREDADAVVRESADLLYNLAVLWADMGIRPEDVWAEMERREQLYGIAEKLLKTPVAVGGVAKAR